MNKPILLSLSTAFIVLLAVRAEDEFVIGVRQDDPEPALQKRKKAEPTEFAGMLGAELKEREYQAQILKIVERFKKGNLAEQELKDIEASIGNSAEKAAKSLVTLLNYERNPDLYFRLAVLETMKLSLYAQNKVVGALLGASAMFDPAPQVRAAAIALIKERNDRHAVIYVFGTLLKSMENGESTAVSNAGTQGAAIAALKELGCRQSYSVLLYYAKISKALGITGPINIDGAKVEPPNTDLHIKVANDEIGGFQAAQTIPGLKLLKQLSGEDFQNDYKKWQEWIDKQPAYKQ